MATPEKIQILQDTTQRIEGARGLYLADFTGMSVEKLSLLRKKCREQKVQFRVIKNTLLKRAFNAHGITALDAFLEGPTGLVFSPSSEVAPAKILADFAKEIAVLATLPSYEVLLSQVLSTFIAPMTQFLAAIDATLRLPATMADVL